MSNTFKYKKMQHFELKGQIRQVGNKAVIKAFRRQGLVPCNLYGCGIGNVLFTVSAKDLKAVTNTPKSFIIDIVLDNGSSYTAVLHELQWHPVDDNCLHVDFLAVDGSKPVAIDIPIVITGHAIGAQQGGKFYQISRSIRVSAMMNDLPDEVTVDITNVGLDKKIKAGDLKYDNISILSDKDMIICGVKSTRNVTAVAEEAA